MGSQLKNIEVSLPIWLTELSSFQSVWKNQGGTPAFQLSDFHQMGTWEESYKQCEFVFHQFCEQLAISEQFLLHN